MLDVTPSETHLRILPAGFYVRDLAEASRNAAMSFVWCARAWRKRELARWLLGPYARTIIATRERIPRRRLGEGQMLREESVRDVVRDTHHALMDTLRLSSTWGRAHGGFAGETMERGCVAEVVDEDGTLGWAPVSRPGMGLLDRVGSLFVADFLTRPADYARFRICAGCDGATFDHYNEHAETCGEAIPLVAKVSRRRVLAA